MGNWILASAVVLTVAALAVALVRTIRGDGFGHRPPPPRAPDWPGSALAGLDVHHPVPTGGFAGRGIDL